MRLAYCRMRSDSVPGVEYEILKFPKDKEWQCTCPDYKFRRRDCKHIKKAKKSMGEPDGDNAT